MEFKKVLALRGPNTWASFPVLEAWVDLGKLNETSSDQVPGFNDRLKAWLPSLVEHRCSEGERGGFFARLDRGTYPAHILEHVALELQSLAGTEVGFGRARATSATGEYRVAVQYKEEELGRACLAAARELILAALNNTPHDVEAELRRLRELAHQVCLGPSTAAIVKAAKSRGIPFRRLNNESLVQLGYGAKQRRILTAETDRTGAIAEWIAKDKELTRSLLSSVGVPVPQGRPVRSAEDAWAAAQEIGCAVVVKPQYGNHGRGVTTNLTTRDQVTAAYSAAIKEGDSIIVESFAPGDDYRILVIGGRVAAAARREPAQVIGDGQSTIVQLVETVNRDPRRSEGHSTSLSKIELNELALAVLVEQGYTPESVPPAGAMAIIRRNANLSTGGTATDVTELVHPEIAARAVDAAHVVGLDIAGVDVVALDIDRPLEEQGGVIVEVNAGPGLRMHLDPSYGKPQPVGGAIIDMMFPAGETGRIPIVAVTGTNGKTTTTRLIAHLLKTSGNCVGMTCTDGIFVGERKIEAGDCAGPQSALAVLTNPKVEAAVLETARGGILRAGLGFDCCDVAVVTNIAEGDHLGLSEIETPEDLAIVKRTIVEVVSPGGFAVLNASDPLTAAMAAHCAGKTIFFARDAQSSVISEHRARGGRAVFVSSGSIILAEGPSELQLIPLSQVPLTRGGAIGFQVENVLAAVAAVWALGVPQDTIRKGLKSFAGDMRQVPGRFNVIHAAGATVVVDYGHNTSALQALIEAMERMPHERRSIVFTAAGDRRDCDIIRQGEILGGAFDLVVVYEDQCTRGRPDGEVIKLIRQGLAAGRRVSQILETRGEVAAIEGLLRGIRPGDLVVIQADKVGPTVAFVEKFISTEFTTRESTMSETGNSPIEIREGRLGLGVFAARTIERGEVILQGWGPRVPERSRHSIQVDHDTHVRLSGPIELVNHSCEPNCGVMIHRERQVLEIHALRRIEQGEELHTDYATFEWEILFMTDPCLCGSQACRGYITGYKDLPNETREAYGPFIAEYLQEMELAVGRSG